MEGQFYEHLLTLLKSGEISKIVLQPHMELIPAFEKKGVKYRKMVYTPDFLVYRPDGTHEYIEIKGFAKADALLRRKFFNYKYPDDLSWIIGTKQVKGKFTVWEDYDEHKKAVRLRKKAKK